MRADDPLIVQADRSILVDLHSPRYDEARGALARFAELEKSPEHMHTYRLSPLALWNAAASGMSANEITGVLGEYARYPLPQNVLVEIAELTSRWGKITLTAGPEGRLRIGFADASLAALARNHKTIGALLAPLADPLAFVVAPEARGPVKQALLKLGHPVDDRAGFTPAVRSRRGCARYPLRARHSSCDATSARRCARSSTERRASTGAGTASSFCRAAPVRHWWRWRRWSRWVPKRWCWRPT
jgi:hypothetical protein